MNLSICLAKSQRTGPIIRSHSLTSHLFLLAFFFGGSNIAASLGESVITSSFPLERGSMRLPRFVHLLRRVALLPQRRNPRHGIEGFVGSGTWHQPPREIVQEGATPSALPLPHPAYPSLARNRATISYRLPRKVALDEERTRLQPGEQRRDSLTRGRCRPTAP